MRWLWILLQFAGFDGLPAGLDVVWAEEGGSMDPDGGGEPEEPESKREPHTGGARSLFGLER